jgi:hypothetical protein
MKKATPRISCFTIMTSQRNFKQVGQDVNKFIIRLSVSGACEKKWALLIS